MNCYYEDIIKKIDEEPQWFDEYAVPRYCKFTPREAANIYANECALALIACQDCHRKFKVCFSRSAHDDIKHMVMFGKNKKPPTLAEAIKNKTIHYGDPPNIRCCPAGPTMNCDDLKVLEYWVHNKKFEWVRRKRLEIELDYSYWMGIERVDK